MLVSSSSEPALPAAWIDALDHIQRVLADALQAAGARALALEAAPTPGPLSSQLFPEEKLAPASESVLDCTEFISETERALTSAQEAVDRWMAAAAQVGQRLAEQAGRAV